MSYILWCCIKFKPVYLCEYTLKNSGLFQPKFRSNMDKPKCWVKNVISNFNPTSTFTLNCYFF